MVRNAKYQSTRTFRAYGRIAQACWHALRRAKRATKGQFYDLMTAMLLSALALEAYLNHLGRRKIEFWEQDKVQYLGPMLKLRILCTEIGYSLDLQARPFQTFRRIFGFRNRLVHATTELRTGKGTLLLEKGQRPPKPLGKWEREVTVHNALLFSEDVRDMIRALHSAAGLVEELLFVPENMYTEVEYLDGEQVARHEGLTTSELVTKPSPQSGRAARRRSLGSQASLIRGVTAGSGGEVAADHIAVHGGDTHGRGL